MDHSFMTSTQRWDDSVQPKVEACGQREGRDGSHYDVHSKNRPKRNF